MKRDKETRPESERPISHWLLAIGSILPVAGGIVAQSSEGHATSPTYFGVFFASVGDILFPIAILVELFSTLGIRRILP